MSSQVVGHVDEGRHQGIADPAALKCVTQAEAEHGRMVPSAHAPVQAAIADELAVELGDEQAVVGSEACEPEPRLLKALVGQAQGSPAIARIVGNLAQRRHIVGAGRA